MTMTQLTELPPEIQRCFPLMATQTKAALTFFNALLASGKARIEEDPVVIEGGMYVTIKRLIIDLE